MMILKKNFSMQIEIKDFLEYDPHPPKGKSLYSDSGVFELEFEDYWVKAHISMECERWYWPQTFDSPEEDEFDVKKLIVEIIRAERGEGKKVKDLKKLEKYIEENLEII